MRILFAGTPEISVPSLEFLAKSGHEVALLTQPDQPGKRGRELQSPPAKTAALEWGLRVFQPEVLGGSFRGELAAWKPELLISFAFGKIFGPQFLALFEAGGWNLHPSLLPRFRGPSPLSAAILAGDTETGMTLQRLALAMDSGEILLQTSKPLTLDDTTRTLTNWAAQEAPKVLEKALDLQVQGALVSHPQKADDVVFCHLIKSEDARIDWNQPAELIHRQVRAYDLWPGARTLWGGLDLVIWSSTFAFSTEESPATAEPGTVLGVDKKGGILVQTKEGVLGLLSLQMSGKKVLDFRSFLNGAKTFLGSKLGV